ncbi:hypothetical protein N7488_009266 [Penicillium malachiteum]|nr:hypothetical protein N7488_009266 [Penicillium malachiteum]
MEVVQTKEVPNKATLLKHRGDGLGFRDLFLGDPEDPMNNYYVFYATQRGFYSPVHKHNFDQFRFPVQGSITILPDLDVEEGELCYHPEGVKYGPQDDGPEERAVLVLQFGGASKQGYLDHARLKLGEQSLREKGGRFEQGKYWGPNADPSIPVDGFKAIWEECMGQKMKFPEGRYGSVVNMKPKAYTYVQDKSSEAISRKKLGVFSERETRAEVVKVVDGGSWEIPSEDASRFYWVLSGSGSVDGQELKAESAGRLKPCLSATVVCEGADLEILCFVLPTLYA